MSAFYDSDDAVYGVGVFGSARYGVASPTVNVGGVSAVFAFGDITATGGTGVTVPLTGFTTTIAVGNTQQTADANFAAVGNNLTFALGTPDTRSINRVSVTGLSMTVALGVVKPNLTTFLQGFNLTLPLGDAVPFGGTGSQTALTGFDLIVNSNDPVSVTGTATVNPTTLSATFATNAVTSSGVVFNFLPFANNYSRVRTVLLPKADTRSDRTARTEERY